MVQNLGRDHFSSSELGHQHGLGGCPEGSGQPFVDIGFLDRVGWNRPLQGGVARWVTGRYRGQGSGEEEGIHASLSKITWAYFMYLCLSWYQMSQRLL